MVKHRSAVIGQDEYNKQIKLCSGIPRILLQI